MSKLVCNIVCIILQVIVLLVGTNNHGHTAEQVAGGIVEIVTTISTKQPLAQIVVMVRLVTKLRPVLVITYFTILFRHKGKHIL